VRIRAAINALESDGVRTTLWDIERGSWEAMTTLALSLLPNLEELEFSNWPLHEAPSWTSFLSRAADCQKMKQNLPSSLAHLTRVSLSYKDTETGMDIEELKAFMRLNSLRHISAHMVDGSNDWYDEEEDWAPESPDPDSNLPEFSHVTKIAFSYSAIDYRVLAYFLRSCPHLQSFEYDHGGPIVGDADFVPPRFMIALKQVESTLQELTITMSSDSTGSSE
jgi:hypothetical protein